VTEEDHDTVLTAELLPHPAIAGMGCRKGGGQGEGGDDRSDDPTHTQHSITGP
jgi:hypothetical protein